MIPVVRHAALAAALLLLAGCHRSVASDAPDADADLRAKTAAKTLADLAAADAAARAPMPRIAPVPPAPHPPAADESPPEVDDAPDLGGNGAE